MNLRHQYLSLITLIAVIASTIIINMQLSDIRSTILLRPGVLEVGITDVEQFERLCLQFSKEWQANDYAFYLLQPKGSSKIYKQKASSSLDQTTLPLKSIIKSTSSQVKLNSNRVLTIPSDLLSTMLYGSNIDDEKQILILPIYQYNTIVGELYMFYDEDKVFHETEIKSFASQAQVISKLLY